MKKIFKFSWLPIVGAAIIVAIYGGALVAQNQKQNQLLAGKIDRLTTQVDNLKVQLADQNKEVAGVSTNSEQKVKVASKVRTSTPTSTPTPVSSPSPAPTPSQTPTPVSTSTSTPTSTPTPTPIPTPTPTPTPAEQVAVEIQNQGSYQVDLRDGDTAFTVIERAASQNGFSLDYKDYGSDLGVMVNCIGGVCAHDNYYWAFYYNGQYAQVGASSQPVSANDITAWKFETF